MAVTIKGFEGTRIVLDLTSKDSSPDAPKFKWEPWDPGKPGSENPFQDGQSEDLVGRLRVKILRAKGPRTTGFNFTTTLQGLECAELLPTDQTHTSWHVGC